MSESNLLTGGIYMHWDGQMQLLLSCRHQRGASINTIPTV